MKAAVEHLRCPGCAADGAPGRGNIGTRRRHCRVCNNFARAVDREVINRFKAYFPEMFEHLRTEVRRSLHHKYTEEASR